MECDYVIIIVSDIAIHSPTKPCGAGPVSSLYVRRRKAECAARLGKNPDREGKLANSLTAVPAKAGIHFSAARNFQAEAMPYQLSSARAAEKWTPAFAGEARKRAVVEVLAQL
jgi:hypothetical protein